MCSLAFLAFAAPALAQAPTTQPQQKEARVYGQKILYLESGTTGPTVILLHGLGVDSNQWRFTIPALAGFHVYALDQIGFGKSDKPIANYRIQTFVDFLDAFCREAGIQKATLVGHSMGGWIAASYALQHPDRVERLVLVSSAGYSQERLGAAAPTRDALQRLNPATLEGMRELLNLNFANKALINDTTVQAAFTQRLAAGDGHVIDAMIDSILRREDFLDGTLGALKTPTLLVWGREDGLAPLASGETLAKDIAGSRLTVLDKCGHFPHLECFGPFTKVLVEFLK